MLVFNKYMLFGVKLIDREVSFVHPDLENIGM